MELYKPEKSTRKGKKFMVKTKKNGIIHYGDSRYEDFTQHGDKKRREAYCKRSKGIRNKDGKLTYKDKDSANYWSRKLWNC